MDRRKFIKSSVCTSAGAALGIDLFGQDVYAGVIVPGEVPVDGKRGEVSAGVEKHVKVEGYVREPAHKIPVVASADVVVVGGGPAGFAAAVCAAREGSSVILIEKANFLGGLWTGGLVLPVLATNGQGKTKVHDRATGGLCIEICDELLSNGWAYRPDDPVVEPEATKYVLEKTVMEAGVKVLYNATAAGVTMSGDRIESILVDCNTGRLAVKCKTAVDASGDGCVFAFAGDPYEARRYHISNSYRIADCMDPKGGMETPVPGMRFRTIGTRQPEDGLDIFRVSELQQQHRIGVWERVQKLRQDPACKDAYLMEMGPVTGVRVTRVLDSLHNVTLEDSMEWAEYEDCIGMSGICDPFEYKGRQISYDTRPIWQIPYRSLIPRETKNLLVAGRCFGYDQGITWDAREISTCFVTGQAAGTAASMAARQRTSAAEVDIRQLQRSLRAAKVRLDF